MISILLGWDGLDLVSYLLVIYYQNVRSYGAGMLTVLSNRIIKRFTNYTIITIQTKDKENTSSVARRSMAN